MTELGTEVEIILENHRLQVRYRFERDVPMWTSEQVGLDERDNAHQNKLSTPRSYWRSAVLLRQDLVSLLGFLGDNASELSEVAWNGSQSTKKVRTEKNWSLDLIV